MDDLTKLGVGEFLDRLAARSPTPGGGSVAGLAGALACAMARMVVAYSVNKKSDAETTERAESVAAGLTKAEQLMRALITQDAVAYAAMSAAAKNTKKESTSPAEYQDAVLVAISVPMEIAGVASNLLSTLDEFKEAASKYLLSDLGVAAVLADATARAATYSVRVNLRELRDVTVSERIMREAEQIASHCDQRRKSIEEFVLSDLET